MSRSKTISPSDKLVIDFLQTAKQYNANVELIKVLKSRTYRIGDANVLVRSASEGNKTYFFGLNYLTVEEIANLDNPFISFICGSIDRVLIIPALFLFKHLPNISHDRNGEYKINIYPDFGMALKGRGNRLDCSYYVNNWSLLLSPSENTVEFKNTVEESLHSILQGRLLEIGNIRGFETFCPDKSRKFNERRLDDIASLKTCPELQFTDYNLLRQIDVLWFKAIGSHLIPEYAFEVELSTGVWNGVVRMSTLIHYPNVGFYVISNDEKKFRQASNSVLQNLSNRYKFIQNNTLGDLYSAELNLTKLRDKIGL